MPQTPTVEPESSVLLEVEDLRTYFYTEEGELRAVDGVSFALPRGRTLAVVGESGCGKSVMAHSLLRLINRPGKIVSGSVRLHPKLGSSNNQGPLDLLQLREGSTELQQVRGGRVAMVFQESSAALSPVHTIGSQIVEAIALHQTISRRGARRLAYEALDRVGIDDAKLCFRQYPHQLSGGMRQRALIAMALVCEPELLIADEPTTALDATIQAQILSVLKSLQVEKNTSLLLITHDLSVVAQVADEVLVMYLGRVVERAPVADLLSRPRHPYTQGLLASLPSATPVGERLPSIQGAVPALNEIPAGCSFHPRCEHVEFGLCDRGSAPRLIELEGQKGRAVACHRVREIALSQLLKTPKLKALAPVSSSPHSPPLPPVSVAPSAVPSSSRRPEFMSNVRPSSTLRPVEPAADEVEVQVERQGELVQLEEREATLPLPSPLSETPPEVAAVEGTEPPPHTDRPEPFGRASQPPPGHTERPEPFGRASQPPPSSGAQGFSLPGPARLPRSLSPGALTDLLEARGSEPPSARRSEPPLARSSEPPKSDEKGRS